MREDNEGITYMESIERIHYVILKGSLWIRERIPALYPVVDR